MLKNNKTILELSLLGITLASLFGSIVYRVYSLNNAGIVLSIILSIISFVAIFRYRRKFKQTEKPKETPGFTLQFFLLTIAYLISLSVLAYILFSNSSSDSIISPWEKIPKYFFGLYLFATLLLIVIAYTAKKNITALISLHCLLSFSVALIIYKIGYGFDPFIHRATLDLIDKTGEVNPKPFYYLGQYSLVIILHKLSFIPIGLIDKLLVPLMAAIYLPSTLIKTLDKIFSSKKINNITALTMLILPFGFFIVTTPQNLAYLLLLLVVLRGLDCKNHYDLLFIYLLSSVALLTQPVAGIPALIFSIVITIYHSDLKKTKKYLYALAFFALAVALPLAFFLLNRINANTTSVGAVNNAMSPFSLDLSFALPNQENVILNFLYLYGLNIKFLVIVLALAGVIIAWKNKESCRIMPIYLTSSISIFVSYIMVMALPFSFLISYERSDYADRLLNVATIFLLPFILLCIFFFFSQLDKQVKPVRYALLFCLGLLITASLYFSYPRLDRYHNSHGYSVGQNDLDAVTWIENDAQNNDYLVLANQQTSAAALYLYGFKKYYHDNIFYYPVPTGGQMYQYYLKMVYESPERKTINEAMDLAGVNQAYFVLNKYWWASSKIAAEAKLSADSWQEFNQGEVLVFKFAK